MTAAQTPPLLTRDACRDYLERMTFRLRPPDYQEKYPRWPGAVGLEMEMLPVGPGANGPCPVPLQDQGEGNGAPGAATPVTSVSILRQEALRRGWRQEVTTGDHGQPLLLRLDMEGGDNVSFEPGGQVEFSSRPYPCLSEAVLSLRGMQEVLDKAYQAHGLRLVQMGINPWHDVNTIGLQMPKGRYRAMDRHFAAISPYGQRMMRQTCTVQVNLDFGPTESSLVNRYLASQLLAPVAAATFAYSPLVDGKDSGIASFRTRIWRHADNSRTGLPGLERVARERTRAACIDSYLEFVLAARVVFVAEPGPGHEPYWVPEHPVSFGQWLQAPLAGVPATWADFETHLTLMFPEVRPRGFLELRSIDCQPRAFQAVSAAYLTGLLYDDRSLQRVLDLLLPLRSEINAMLARAEGGLADDRLATLAKTVMDIAAEGFARLPSCFKTAGIDRELAVFKDHFTDRRRTPADDLLAALAAGGQGALTLEVLADLESRWSAML